LRYGGHVPLLREELMLSLALSVFQHVEEFRPGK
jgi:hypothetical protein